MKYAIMVLAVMVALAGCASIDGENGFSGEGNDIACTMEAKLCPDGSYVGRNPGNGCAFDPCPETGNISKYYVSESTEECTLIDFRCKEGMTPFFDGRGCGCEPLDGKLKANECPEPRPEYCTKEYMPVCGWFNQSIQCIKYPCAATYGNGCTACSDPNVEYWTQGACPA